MSTPPKHHPSPRHEQHLWLGVSFAILAAISFTAMSLMGKIIGDRASTDTILFVRFAISLVLILPWAVMKPKEVIHVVQPMKIISRSLFTLLAFACFFYSLKFISLSNALLLNNTFPLFVPIVALCLLGSKTPYKVWMSILLGFLGIVLVLNPDPKVFQPVSLIGLSSGIFAAISIVIIRSLTKVISILQILFYNFFVCTILSGIFLFFNWKSLDTTVLLPLGLVGLFGACYQFFSTLSFAKAPVRVTSPLMFLCIVLGVLADYLIWKQVPTILTLSGMACVIAGGAMTIYFGQKEILQPKQKDSE